MACTRPFEIEALGYGDCPIDMQSPCDADSAAPMLLHHAVPAVDPARQINATSVARLAVNSIIARHLLPASWRFGFGRLPNFFEPRCLTYHIVCSEKPLARASAARAYCMAL